MRTSRGASYLSSAVVQQVMAVRKDAQSEVDTLVSYPFSKKGLSVDKKCIVLGLASKTDFIA